MLYTYGCLLYRLEYSLDGDINISAGHFTFWQCVTRLWPHEKGHVYIILEKTKPEDGNSVEFFPYCPGEAEDLCQYPVAPGQNHSTNQKTRWTLSLAGESPFSLQHYKRKALSVPAPPSCSLPARAAIFQAFWWQLGPAVNMITAADRKVILDLPIHSKQSQQPGYSPEHFLQDTLLPLQSVMMIQLWHNPLSSPCPLSTKG